MTPDTSEPLLARLAPQTFGEIGATPPAEIMVFPAGTHTIHATQGGRTVEKTVAVGPDTAATLQAALQAHLAAGPQKPYFDFDHDDTRASAWPTAFRWEPGPARPAGVYATVEWSGSGATAVLGKDYRSFSPAFHVDRASPARVTGAPLNMGGLVNSPAFKAQSPIWAKESSAAEPNNRQPDKSKTMKEDAPAAAAAPDAEAIQAKATITALKTQVEALEAKETARRKADAAAAVQAAVARGALPPKDEAIQAKWRGLIEADSAHATLLEAMPGRDLTQPVTAPGGHITAKAGPVEVLKAYAAASGADRTAIYAKDIAPLFKPGFALGPILAANSLGTLTGDLVAQRALTLLKLSFPVLRSISTDFSAENAAFNQAVKTRLRTVPAVSDYDTATGYPTADATTTDVAITINAHKAVQIGFNANELASTQRDIFGEQAEGAHYALGKALVDALYALITAGNYANATTKALATFARADVTAMAKALYNRGVPEMGRTLILNPDYFEKLGQDATLVSLAAFQKPEVITDWVLPPVAKFNILQAVNLPGTGNLTGFGFTPDALAMATRVPNDYTQALAGASNGSVSVVTNPDTGISVQLVQYVNHQLGASYWRIALMFGVAKGQAASGQRLISA